MNNEKKFNLLKMFVGIFFLIIAIWLGLHAGTEYNENPDCTSPIEAVMFGAVAMFIKPWTCRLYLNSKGLIPMVLALAVYGVGLIIYKLDEERNKHFDSDIACGSAKWNTDLKAYNKKFTDPVDSASNKGPNNMILTQNVHLNLNGHVTRKNNNVVVVGGSGSGKSRFYVKPNILQANCNYVITDPAGDLLASTGSFLESQGYEIKVFNLVEMAKSDCYNPFDYIRDDLGVVMMVRCLITNTTPPGRKGGDPFWEKSEEALLQALCFYLIHHRPKKYHNFTTVMSLLRAAIVDEQHPNAKSTLDRMFDDVEKVDPNSIALKQYKTFKMGAEKTLKSILISCSVRLTVFNLQQIESLTCRDTIELEKMGEGKKALFVIIPSADSTYNFLVSMMYSQLFETLYYIAETKTSNKRLPSRVRFLLDEFANIGEIPDFTKKLATMRKYDISCSIILQNLAQIKTMYKDDWQTILGNCDSFLFLGGQEYETVEYISKELGDTTIVVRDRSASHGKSRSSSKSYKTTNRKLMTPDEVMRLKENECILMISKLYPFKDDKYEYTKHPNYHLTGDADENYLYVNRKNNKEPVTLEKINVDVETEKAKKYRAAVENPTPSNKIIGDFKNVEGLCKTLGINSAEEAKKQLIPVKPNPANAVSQQITIDEMINSLDEDKPDGANAPLFVGLEIPSTFPEGSVATNNEEDDNTDSANTSTVNNTNDKDIKTKSDDRRYPYSPSEKTQMRNSRVTTGSLVLSTESDKEVWDFDPVFM